MNRIPSIFLGVAVVLWSHGFAQESKPAESGASRPVLHDLTISEAPRNVLVEVTNAGKGKITVKSGASQLIQTFDHKGKSRWIDEIGDRKGKTKTNRRTFLEAQSTDNGVNKDPGLEGITFVMNIEGDLVKMEAEGGRRALIATINQQIMQGTAIGLFAELPASVEVGARFPLGAAALILALIDTEGAVRDVEGDMLLERVDPATNHAFVTSSVSFVQDYDKEGASLSFRFRVALTIEIDLAAHEVVKASAMGKAKIEGRGQLEGKVSGELDVEAKGTAKPATDVAAAKNRKPWFRENVHKFAGLEIRLPSCWLAMPETQSGVKSFLDGRVTPNLIIELNLVKGVSDPSTDEFIAALSESLKGEDPKAKVQKASLPIGKAASFELVTSDGKAVRGHAVSHVDGLIRIRLLGAPEAVKKVESEYKAMVQSMKKAKP